MNNQIYLVWN